MAFGGNKVVALFKVTYDAATGVPSIAKIGATPAVGSNIDGVAFYPNGDLAVVSASAERFVKFAVKITEPTVDVENVESMLAPTKVIKNGQLIIMKNGVEYNVLGAVVK